MNDVRREKSTVERYSIRAPHCLWAEITVDEKLGLLQISSDYGGYEYRWGSHGRESFKHFLVEIGRDKDYICKKLAGRDEYDRDTTEDDLKARVLRARRENSCTKEEARAVWRYVTEELDLSNPDTIWHTDVPFDWDNDTPLRIVFGSDWQYNMNDSVRYRIPIQCQMFFEKIYQPVFVPWLKEELKIDIVCSACEKPLKTSEGACVNCGHGHK